MSRKIRTIIVDDEPLARQTVEDLLIGDHEIEVCCSCSDGVEALKVIRDMNPELVFLDIQMPDLNGFDVLEALIEEPGIRNLPFIVFVTAHDRFALRAFEYHALDYILKPFSDSRFLEAVTHAKKQIAALKSAAIQKQLVDLLHEYRQMCDSKASGDDRFAIQSGGRTVFVDLKEVIWFEAAEHYVQIHTKSKSIICRESMTNLEMRLDPNRFIRVHRSAIVNTYFVEELYAIGKSAHELRLRTGKRLRVSHAGLKKLRQNLDL